uniref:Preprotein-translocase subunit g n=1 Tax=Bostrychia tenella TaxID=324755 RepID=A0A1Z1M5D0_9FLOR|nr:preprotein-translocase subunit g [Bostrychia tenella]ARW61268.1 preprotein-translocase subunit g [Bostrychia tenella]
MINFLWYIFILLLIFFILINNPSSINLSNFSTQTKVMNFSSNQFLIQKFIVFSILMFFILTILRVVY